MHHSKIVLLLAIVAPFLLSHCGKGSSGDSSEATTRPKSMDGITLTIPGGASFAFTRTNGTDAALTNGQSETGSFIYTLNGTNLQQYQNIQGDQSDISFPDALTGGRSYTYLAVNENSGVLTLTGTPSNDLRRTGGYNAENASFAFYFESDSSGLISDTIQMDITFVNNNNSVITAESVVLSIVGSTTPELDTTIPSNPSVLLTGGGQVPYNYNPSIDTSRDSLIVPESLNGMLILFTNGVPEPTNDFTVQFVKDVSSPNIDTDEIGSGLERVDGSVVNIGVQYTWQRIGGTDSATLVLSGGSNTFDGSYELSFGSENSGTYVGTVDSGTADAAEVSGTFVTRMAN